MRPVCAPGPAGHCSVCGDEAVAVRVLAVDCATDTARVVGPLEADTVALDLVEDVMVGDRLMVHMGFAIARMEGGDVAEASDARTSAETAEIREAKHG